VVWPAALLLLAGELWTASELRHLRETEDVRDASAIAELDAQVPAERRRAEHALGRLEQRKASRLLAATILDGTASPFAVELYLALSGKAMSVPREKKGCQGIS